MLLQHRAQIDAVTSPCGRTAIHLAAHSGHDQAVRVLVGAGASTEIRNGAGRGTGGSGCR